MPVEHVVVKGRPDYRWGKHGKVYFYVPGSDSSRREAKRKAYVQAYAAEHHGAK
jgi:hypothetical protein